ncbi:hypothetical protein HY031_00145 [Candidatus Gottesmanbacteria bacterium]|nr:hypothetical protein [Candidatus Gottesmanbacteria bacterium]
MRKIFLLALFVLLALWALPVQAASQQAYQQYLSQIDLYRKTYKDFTTARDAYLKFQTLTSQSDALTKTKLMLTSRNQLLLSYANFLSEKIAENPGLEQTQKQQYLDGLQKESAFISGQNALVSGITSIEGATGASKTLETHYPVYQASVQKAIIGLILGNLTALADQYDDVAAHAQDLVSLESQSLPADKLATLNNWILQINAKRAQFQQTIDTMSLTNAKLDSVDSFDLDRQVADLHTQAAQARQNLVDGASFVNELVSELKYAD